MKKDRISLLDLGGVVFQSTGTSNAVIHWKVISQLNDQYGHALNIGEDLFPDFLASYNQLTGQTLSGEAFLAAVFDTLRINSELIELLRSDSDIIIVSDNYRENIEYISKRYDFESWSVGQIYSYDYQMVKSNPLFFEKLLKDLEPFEKQQMVFIDDSPKKIESAQKSGIKGILFQNTEQVKQALRDLNLSKL